MAVKLKLAQLRLYLAQARNRRAYEPEKLHNLEVAMGAFERAWAHNVHLRGLVTNQRIRTLIDAYAVGGAIQTATVEAYVGRLRILAKHARMKQANRRWWPPRPRPPSPAALPRSERVKHSFPLRHDLRVDIILPGDFSNTEGERMAAWIRTLAAESARKAGRCTLCARTEKHGATPEGATCTACGNAHGAQVRRGRRAQKVVVRHSLPVVREGGRRQDGRWKKPDAPWMATPICNDCARAVRAREPAARFFDLVDNIAEAEARNARDAVERHAGERVDLLQLRAAYSLLPRGSKESGEQREDQPRSATREREKETMTENE